MDGRTFVISDIHGCYNAFIKLLEAIEYDKDKDRIFVLGDMIDRGPDSALVVDTVIQNKMTAIAGNHELFLLDYIDGALDSRTYFTALFGGYHTLKSYERQSNSEELFQNHVSFIEQLPYALQHDKYFFIHEGFPLNNDRGNLIKIFGHTSTDTINQSLGIKPDGFIFYDEKSKKNVCIDCSSRKNPKLACLNLTDKEETYVYLSGLSVYKRRCPVDWI